MKSSALRPIENKDSARENIIVRRPRKLFRKLQKKKNLSLRYVLPLNTWENNNYKILSEGEN
jgi:hypothetical protein